MQLHIGIDDTDSPEGGCTTYIAARLVEKLAYLNVRFIDYPNIIRLNPNIPYKTRGNAAVALRLRIAGDARGLVEETVLEEVEKNSELGTQRTEPAVVFLERKPTRRIRDFARRALANVLDPREALHILKRAEGSAVAYGAECGLVGALAAVGETLDGDHTFELVAYRTRRHLGTPRRIDEDSVKTMDRLTRNQTFNNYDWQNKRVLITPHGPDPVLAGIRGESPEAVLRAFQMLEIQEPVERWTIFRTNHGTDAHLKGPARTSDPKPNSPAVLRGVVEARPRRIRGGHVFMDVRCGSVSVNCAAFEPTGPLREIVARLLPGDKVTLYGGVKEMKAGRPLTINLEKIQIHNLVDDVRLANPACPRCGKRLKSAGRGQGFRCEKCSASFHNIQKGTVTRTRRLEPGLYLPSPKAQRHLTKPSVRYGREKVRWDHRPPGGIWHYP